MIFVVSWLNPLEELISQINTKYGQFFRMMGCAGEVSLAKDQVAIAYCYYQLTQKHLIHI